MQINKKILEILKDFKIKKDDGMCYLIAMYYGYKPDYIPNIIKQKIRVTKIFETDSNNSIRWNIALFNNQKIKFNWVETEYIPLFKSANSSKGGYVKESTKRMEKFFADNPDIRKDEVLGATKMYLLNTNPNYIRFPHYFIMKGSGVTKTSDLMTWVEKYKINTSSQSDTITNKMQ